MLIVKNYFTSTLLKFMNAESSKVKLRSKVFNIPAVTMLHFFLKPIYLGWIFTRGHPESQYDNAETILLKILSKPPYTV